jgi:energy-coupling factor transport system permease protein
LATSNPVLLGGLGAVALVVAMQCRSRAPWGAAATAFVKLAVVVVVIRVLFQVLFGQRLPGTEVCSLPSITLPSWAAGVSIGGPVTVEALLSALTQGLRLAVVLLAFGAANAIASPREVLRSLPGILSEAAVALSVGLCFVPEVLASLQRVRTARRLRGRPVTGIAGWRGTAVPVLEDALARSVQLAASMGTRGFGREGPPRSTAQRVGARVMLVLGAPLVLLAGYCLLADGGPLPTPWIFVLLGAALVAGAVLLGPRRAQRTRYRPAPFGFRSLACLASGWAAAICFAISPAGVHWTPWPLSWPTPSALAVVGIALGLTPILLHAPAPERVASPRAQVIA